MKKLLLSSLLGFGSFIYADVNAVVSILPQQTFLKKIGGDKVNIALMVKQGQSPHTYEPKPSQMKQIAKADVYFSIGVEFEKNWLNKFANQNKNMKIIDVSTGIKKQEIEDHDHAHHDEHKEHSEHDDHEKHNYHDDHAEHNEHNKHAKHDKHDDHEEHHEHNDHEKEIKELDPHIWTSPLRVKSIAVNMYKTLVKLDKENKKHYQANLKKFITEVDNTDKRIKEILKNTPKHTKFMVFHPSWGYFASEYNLEQLAIESGGKNPKPKQIAHLIEEAKEENVKAVFTAPEFSTKSANQIAREVGVPVVKVSPLNPNWSENLIGLARALAGK